MDSLDCKSREPGTKRSEDCTGLSKKVQEERDRKRCGVDDARKRDVASQTRLLRRISSGAAFREECGHATTIWTPTRTTGMKHNHFALLSDRMH